MMSPAITASEPLDRDLDREMVRRVPRRGFEPDLVVEGEIAFHQLRLAGLDHRQYAVRERQGD